MTPFNSEGFPESLAIATENELRIGIRTHAHFCARMLACMYACAHPHTTHPCVDEYVCLRTNVREGGAPTQSHKARQHAEDAWMHACTDLRRHTCMHACMHALIHPHALACACTHIGTIDDIQKLHIRRVLLNEQPRRICHQAHTCKHTRTCARICTHAHKQASTHAHRSRAAHSRCAHCGRPSVLVQPLYRLYA